MANEPSSINKTVTSTPTPISCSTTGKNRDKNAAEFKKRLSQIDTELEDSLGILSIRTSDLDFARNRTNHTRDSISMDLQQQRLLATSCLERVSRMEALPSRLLRPSDISKTGTETRINATGSTSESTINESDLFERLPSESSSTPRGSEFSSKSVADEPRLSLGQSMAILSQTMNNSNISLSKFIEEYKKTMNTDLFQSNSFQSGDDAGALLDADEMSWRREKSIPVSREGFSLDNISQAKISMGDFFQKHSESLSVILPKTPEKRGLPVPLVEITNDSTLSLNSTTLQDSLSISAIARILQDNDKTPGRTVDILLNNPANKQNEGKPTGIHPEKPIAEKEKENVHVLTDENRPRINSAAPSSNYTDERYLASSRSSSSLSCLPNGRLPIDSTKKEIVWGCVKVGKSSSEEFIIRNKSSSRVKFQCAVTKPYFKIISKDHTESESLMCLKLSLRPHESRTITICFSPTTVGAAVDNINFTPLEPHLEQSTKQCVKLFGYGGTSAVSLCDITKDTSGKYWLQLGNVGDSEIRKTFSVQNTGSLSSFVYFTFTPKASYAFASVFIDPAKLTLAPQQTAEITVTYVIRKSDLKVLHNAGAGGTVMEIGNVKMVSGSEANRGRIRRLCHKAAEKNLEIDPLSREVAEKFPGEHMPADLRFMSESVGAMKELVRTLNCREIYVTLEQDPDRTLVAHFPADETSLFQTLTADDTASNNETAVCKVPCKVEPLHVVLTPPGKKEDRILLTSMSTKQLQFDISSGPEGLEIQPTSGTILPGKTVIVLIKNRSKADNLFKVNVSVDNEIFEVSVKVFFVN